MAFREAQSATSTQTGEQKEFKSKDFSLPLEES
jgi:hypothetical protein